ncbi:uncharacterized membrane protein YhaH (DUF805 family) [Mucilaginibacter oryzae]|uniref:Uncharacterized membrane protein YhaH (DUF805 family) n=1 Tax=Mucilaginibacter oryzae TaxID=468058 RepID=A0A316H990_9SPHI|nr:DUF805 domain-containing protein [Mucilaginibacter oryzae]PWK76550.1 uncharacterized membrane protein YhaH (DUF805 family) [Mucilaginibacter oryzae]
MNYYIEVLKNYALFSGRARRSEYWYFALFNVIFSMILSFVGVFLKFPLLSNIYSLAILIPSIAVGVRRMHDVGKSGWFILIPIYNLILACTDGTPGENQYGPDPKNRTGFGAGDYERPVNYNSPQ